MTNKEFLNAVIATEGIAQELIAHAQAEIEKIDKANEKRRNTPTKSQAANEGLKASMLTIFVGRSVFASEVAQELEISTQKASSLLRQLVAESGVTVADVKVKGRGSVKQYTFPKAE